MKNESALEIIARLAGIGPADSEAEVEARVGRLTAECDRAEAKLSAADVKHPTRPTCEDIVEASELLSGHLANLVKLASSNGIAIDIEAPTEAKRTTLPAHSTKGGTATARLLAATGCASVDELASRNAELRGKRKQTLTQDAVQKARQNR